jgi:ribosomal protein S18 acetylase RimI-like enzyme
LAFTLRPVASTDDDFLYHLYGATHGQQFALLPVAPAQLDALLRMQFHAQRSGYRQQYPASQDFVVLVDGQPGGRVWLDDSQPQHLHLLDIALLPRHQGSGIGAAVLRQVMEQASRAAKAVTLHVARMNARALEFYQRLGFTVSGGDDVYVEMKWGA